MTSAHRRKSLAVGSACDRDPVRGDSTLDAAFIRIPSASLDLLHDLIQWPILDDEPVDPQSRPAGQRTVHQVIDKRRRMDIISEVPGRVHRLGEVAAPGRERSMSSGILAGRKTAPGLRQLVPLAGFGLVARSRRDPLGFLLEGRQRYGDVFRFQFGPLVFHLVGDTPTT